MVNLSAVVARNVFLATPLVFGSFSADLVSLVVFDDFALLFLLANSKQCMCLVRACNAFRAKFFQMLFHSLEATGWCNVSI